MCGIAGFISTLGVSEPSALDAVQRMTDRMSAQGPDAEGVWASEGVALGHRRLAILDLDARAYQPMAFPSAIVRSQVGFIVATSPTARCLDPAWLVSWPWKQASRSAKSVRLFCPCGVLV